MALRPQASFSAGELDPALCERVTLQKFDTGLKTGKNVAIGKTGRLMSPSGRKNFIKTGIDGRRVIIHAIGALGTFLEIGHKYVRVYVPSDDNPLVDEYVSDYTEDDLENLQIIDGSTGYVYFFLNGSATQLFSVVPGGGFISSANTFYAPAAPTIVSNTVSGTGYNIEYAITAVIGGQESLVLIDSTSTPKLPISNGEINTIVANLGPSAQASIISEMRVYRRPAGGGAFGFIGSSSAFSTSGSNRRGTFVDVGNQADYTHSPPTLNITLTSRGSSGPTALASLTGVIYQQRLLMSVGTGIEASRTGFQNNFYRDYPLNADSSLSFKTGSSGAATILRLIDYDGLIAFTSEGVFLHTGALSPQNITMDRKGGFIIDEKVPPLAIPGGLLFVDAATNSIRRLVFSLENGSFIGQEVSVFSDHLFLERKIVSWAFEEGATPLLWCVFSDGKFASFTYEADQEMRAWTRHEYTAEIKVEQVAFMKKGFDQLTGIKTEGKTVWVVEKDDVRYIELGVPRYVSADTVLEDSEHYLGENIALMNSFVSWKRKINDETRLTNTTVSLTNVGTTATATVTKHGKQVGDEVTIYNAVNYDEYNGTFTIASVPTPDTFTYVMSGTPSGSDTAKIDLDEPITLTPVTADVWDGPLTMSCGGAALFTVGDLGALNTRFRYFRTTDKTFIDLVVTARTDDNTVTVEPSEEFPSTPAGENPNLYLTKMVFDGLDHMEGEEVSIVCDGYIVSSPYNDDQDYPAVVVSGGEIELPSDLTGAIVHIGRPIISDIETLDIATVEQRPVFNESKTVNKVYVKTHRTSGTLYVGNKFPPHNRVNGMQLLDSYDVDYTQDYEVVPNRYQEPSGKKAEITLPGDWSSNGRVCIRSVDPLHWEILSITTDLHDERR